jgi:hypothetical protein
MRVFVVGASDFLRRPMIVRLGRDGHAVTCAGRDEAPLRRRFPGRSSLRVDWQPDGQPHLAGLMRS